MEKPTPSRYRQVKEAYYEYLTNYSSHPNPDPSFEEYLIMVADSQQAIVDLVKDYIRRDLCKE